MAVGMNPEQFAPFFISLEKTGYRGDICLCVADLAPAALDFLRARRVNLVPFRKAYLKHKWSRLAPVCKPFMKPHQQRQFDEQILLTYLHLHCARHVYYREYLAECGGMYDQIMLADVRDILFQRDPFDFEMFDGLHVFKESVQCPIGKCYSNSTWLREGFGAGVLKQLADKPIYCAGTIFGPPAVMKNYCEQVLQIFAERRPNLTIDQATHNFIMHTRPPKMWRAFDNDTGPVLTMAKLKPDQFHFNEQGLMTNSTGRVFNTLHQYDRHLDLAPRLMQTLT